MILKVSVSILIKLLTSKPEISFTLMYFLIRSSLSYKCIFVILIFLINLNFCTNSLSDKSSTFLLSNVILKYTSSSVFSFVYKRVLFLSLIFLPFGFKPIDYSSYHIFSPFKCPYALPFFISSLIRS